MCILTDLYICPFASAQDEPLGGGKSRCFDEVALKGLNQLLAALIARYKTAADLQGCRAGLLLP